LNEKLGKIVLGDVASEIRELYEPNEIEQLKFVGLKHIEKNTLRITSFGNSSDTQSTKKKFSKGDILFGSLRPYFRKVAVADFNGVCSTDITVVRSNEKIDQLFLFHLIANQDFINYATKISSGTRMPRANWKVLSKSIWTVPTLNEQKKIGKLLYNFTELIKINENKIRILEEIAQLIYHEWFVKYRYPGYKDVPLVDSGTDFGMIPEGWRIEKLSNLVKTQYGYTQSATDEEIGPKYVRGTDINKETYINWSTVPYCKIPKNELKKFKLKKGDILIIRMADPGKSGIIEQNINAIFASYLIRIEIRENLTPYYLFYFLQSDAYKKYIEIASTGTTRKSASAGVLTNVNLIVPKKELLLKFEQLIEKLRNSLNIILLKSEKLSQIRDLLLPKLISGQIDVSELDIQIDEEEKDV